MLAMHLLLKLQYSKMAHNSSKFEILKFILFRRFDGRSSMKRKKRSRKLFENNTSVPSLCYKIIQVA